MGTPYQIVFVLGHLEIGRIRINHRCHLHMISELDLFLFTLLPSFSLSHTQQKEFHRLPMQWLELVGCESAESWQMRWGTFHSTWSHWIQSTMQSQCWQLPPSEWQLRTNVLSFWSHEAMSHMTSGIYIKDVIQECCGRGNLQQAGFQTVGWLAYWRARPNASVPTLIQPPPQNK